MNLQRIWCFFTGHNRESVEARNRVEDGAYRVDAQTGERERIPGCEIVDECQRCGDTELAKAAITVVERRDIPKRWDE